MGRLHTVVIHAATVLETAAFIGSGVVPLRQAEAAADLLPHPRQEQLRRLQQCRVLWASPLVRHTNPMD
jgi:hypothetical protein